MLDNFLTERSLEEIPQPQNTFFRMNKSQVTGTRIDRWYCNVSPAQWAVAQPTCRVLSSTPQTVGSYFGGNLKKLTYFPSMRSDKATHITDHVPVAIYMLPPGTAGNASNAPSIPNWVLSHPSFLEKLTDNWSPLGGGVVTPLINFRSLPHSSRLRRLRSTKLMVLPGLRRKAISGRLR